MAAIPFGKSAYRRDRGNFAELKLVNMLVEPTPTGSEQVTILSLPGFETYRTLGAGPIDGMFAQSGVFGGDIFAASGGELYRGVTSVGTLTGSGAARFSTAPEEIVVTRGAALFSYRASLLAAVAFPDSADVAAVAYLAGLFVAVRKGTNKFYWSGILDGRTWDALDFASAESSPDELRDTIAIGDELAMLGSESVEFWQSTGDVTLPLIRSQGRLYRKGVIAADCAAEMDNALFWIGNDFIVYRGGDAVPTRVSDNGIEERVAASTTWRAFKWQWEGHALFCVKLDSGCWGFDAASGSWCQMRSWGQDGWRVSSALTFDGIPYFGDETTGDIWEFGGWNDGTDTLERLFSAGGNLLGGSVTVDTLRLETNPGATDVLTGQGSDPQIEMRSSRDGGRTWSAWRQTALGAQGEYRTRVEWRRCGMFDAPGLLFECRVTDPVPLRVSAVAINEAGGGRGR